MIENDLQLEITKKHLANFTEEVNKLEAREGLTSIINTDPLLKEIYIASLKSWIERFNAEIDAYNNK